MVLTYTEGSAPCGGSQAEWHAHCRLPSRDKMMTRQHTATCRTCRQHSPRPLCLCTCLCHQLHLQSQKLMKTCIKKPAYMEGGGSVCCQNKTASGRKCKGHRWLSLGMAYVMNQHIRSTRRPTLPLLLQHLIVQAATQGSFQINGCTLMIKQTAVNCLICTGHG